MFDFIDLIDFYFNSTVKDMQPYTIYKKDNSYIIEIKTLGINPNDINVKLEEQESILYITGETKNKYSKTPYNVNIKLRVTKDILNSLKQVNYTSENGITYVTLMLKDRSKNKIPVIKNTNI